MKFAWKALITLGALLALFAMNMDTTVSTGFGRVHNVGLVSQQQTLLILGCALFVGGLIVFGVVKLKQTPEDEAQERERREAAVIRAQETLAKSKAQSLERLVAAGVTINKVDQSARRYWGLLKRRYVLLAGALLLLLASLFPPREATTWDQGGVMVKNVVRPLLGTSNDPLLAGTLIREFVWILLGTSAVVIAISMSRRGGRQEGEGETLQQHAPSGRGSSKQIELRGELPDLFRGPSRDR
ncbi:hypothetical protein JI739_18700 [Ramlibacter sp. AW1]|uniref:Uncharacterized protein n=1 Tax=Ramlibacter aurantiacus TaxID=2801330 RepID=A0A936ZWG7_9BURK|nr:hypothetical protein [Ramlibacter aurantiacus]MBL0422385.1 hypothetical protein [Ramlibacter aurantiacus]